MSTWNPFNTVVMKSTIHIPGVTGIPRPAGGDPSKFELEQNYPNPFNPTTTTRYEATAAGVVSLTVHDVRGRQVAVLVNEKKQAGSFSVTFDGSGFASGVYFCRLREGGDVRIRAMLLLK